MKAGKVIATLFFASWVLGVAAFMVLRPTFKHGKELLKAVEVGNTPQAERLLQEGAGIQVRDSEGHTALWLAAYYNRADIAKMLLAHGADPNARGLDGWTPLMWAVYNGNVDVVKVLVAGGANASATGLAGETARSIATTDRQKAAAAVLAPTRGR